MEYQTIKRHDDWSARLTDFLQKFRKSSTNFDWQPNLNTDTNANADTQNCLTFAGVACEALFDVNPYKILASSVDYDSPESALVAMQSLGYENMEDIFNKLFTPCGADYLTRGDFVFLPSRTLQRPSNQAPFEPTALNAIRWTTALVDPPYCWCVSSSGGASRVHMRSAIMGFSTATLTLPIQTTE